MIRCVLVLVTGAISLGSVPPTALAQAVHGRLVDDFTDRPVAGALLLLSRGDDVVAQAVSDSLGAFTMLPPEPGDYRLQAIRLGYHGAVIPNLKLGEADVLDFDLLITPRPVSLDGVVVSVPRYESDVSRLGLRLDDLGRRVIRRKDISAQRTARDVGDVLQHRLPPGFRVVRTEHVNLMLGRDHDPGVMDLCVSQARGNRGDGSRQCALTVLDQQIVGREAVSMLAPEDIEAIVLLTPSEAVQRFGTLARGGAVLIYRRRRD